MPPAFRLYFCGIAHCSAVCSGRKKRARVGGWSSVQHRADDTAKSLIAIYARRVGGVHLRERRAGLTIKDAILFCIFWVTALKTNEMNLSQQFFNGEPLYIVGAQGIFKSETQPKEKPSSWIKSIDWTSGFLSVNFYVSRQRM